LHIRESLASINFQDFEPPLIEAKFTGPGPAKVRPLVDDPLFKVEAVHVASGANFQLIPNRLQIVAVLSGAIQISHDSLPVDLRAGQFCLVPACLADVVAKAQADSAFLRIEGR
jgi:mannose-6-phosphate isomerase-like protein (cupin superfamily)